MHCHIYNTRGSVAPNLAGLHSYSEGGRLTVSGAGLANVKISTDNSTVCRDVKKRILSSSTSHSLEWPCWTMPELPTTRFLV